MDCIKGSVYQIEQSYLGEFDQAENDLMKLFLETEIAEVMWSSAYARN